MRRKKKSDYLKNRLDVDWSSEISLKKKLQRMNHLL